MNGAALMAQAVERQGVGTVFALCGHLDVFLGALQDRGIRLIDNRHEAAVVLAADGYARVRRGLGVACVTAGPGLANALGGLGTAFEACTPILVICGRNAIHTSDTGAHQDLDHTDIVRRLTKWAATVYDANRLGEYIDRAARIALSGRPGPVLLEVPSDVPWREVDEMAAAEALRPLVPAVQPLAAVESIEHAATVLTQAARPLVIAGNGAYWGCAGAGLLTLARECRLPVLAKALGRGLVPEDGRLSWPWAIAQTAVREADVILVAGARLGGSLGFGAPPFFREDARFIQIDLDGGEIGRNRYVEAPVVGDCGPAVEAIGAELLRRGFTAPDPDWLAAALADRLARIDGVGREESGQVHPLRIARELAARMPGDAIFVGDGANCLNWFKAVLSVRQAPGWLDHEPFGSMGVGLPLAIGAAAAQQELAARGPVIVGTGDGSFGMYLAELATAARHALPLLVVVANDGAWGANRSTQRRTLGHNYAVDLTQSAYELVARGLDCHGERAEEPSQVGPALDRALVAVRSGQPAVINVLVDPESGAARGEDPRLQMVTFNRDWPRRSSRPADVAR